MNQTLLLLILSSTILAFPGQEDEVVILPGLRIQPTFKHYSGYLNGSATRKLHYWFVESQKSPNKDPLVLWLNGGPGCSSLDGLISENGPFQVTSESYLVPNPNSWNRIANVIYLESPSCVGFSYSTDGKCDASDDSTALLNFHALQEFFTKFPQFKNREFYITGESYGGFYVPTLAAKIVSSKGGLPVKFKGIAVGNGLSSWSTNINGNFYFAYNHGLISDSMWTDIVATCCNGRDYRQCDFFRSQNHNCHAKINEAIEKFQNVNPYNIYAECSSSSDTLDSEIWSKLNVHSNYEKSLILFGWNSDPQHRISRLRNQYNLMKTVVRKLGLRSSDRLEIPCINTTASTTFLNKRRVRYALHIPDHVPSWSVCSGYVNSNFVKNYENMTSQYNTLFQLKDFKIWIYNGDVDMACSYLADEWFFTDLNRKVVLPRKPWMYTDGKDTQQVGGFVKTWDKFVLLTVRGSGHMVPTDRPLPAYHIFDSFINGKSL